MGVRPFFGACGSVGGQKELLGELEGQSSEEGVLAAKYQWTELNNKCACTTDPACRPKLVAE